MQIFKVSGDATTPAAAAGAESPEPTTINQPLTMFAYAVVVLAALAAWAIYEWRDPTEFKPEPGISIFAVLYIAAQAIERILEPFAPLVARTRKTEESEADEKDEADEADAPGGQGAPRTRPATTTRFVSRKEQETLRSRSLAAAISTDDDLQKKRELEKAAAAQEAISRTRRNTALWLWTAATVIALLGSGLIGMTLLTTIGVAKAPVFVDLLVTGLAIGGGTKPLHDLIGNLEKAKEKKDDTAPAVAK